ncbi:CrcB family protein [Nocardioidaceae bacterium]|nr:CrcB family protein [Nocardioidaceae bacterium]
MTALLVMLGGAVGAAGRYLCDRFVSSRAPRDLPAGTLAVNLLGSLALGLLTGLLVTTGSAYAVLGTGVCGAFTTWSTLAVETVELLRGRPALAVAYLAATLLGGLSLATVGLLATGALTPVTS